MLRNDIVLGTIVESFELAFPEIHKILDHVFVKKVHKIPRNSTSKIQGVDSQRKSQHAFNPIIHSKCILVFLGSYLLNSECGIRPVAVFPSPMLKVSWIHLLQLSWMHERNIVCFFGIGGVVDGLDVAGTAWGDSIMPFDIKKFFDGNHIATCEDVVGMEVES